ncbi:alanine--tRNA ligase [Microlunatus sp. Y2014]|uniref:alanine--tRNA ligase n=1 Tax=Microlunatus sp. Y2014 TaxID=3418488 RepID=UPI003DA747C4
MNTADIRRRFLEYFQRRNHLVLPSAPLVYNDPNLLFVNAGMVPMKPYFLGSEPPPAPSATSVQKCVRTLDIEEVGKTTRHGTFFQMCGNFSFGEYFKAGAIQSAWELITGTTDSGGLGFDPESVWVTVLAPGLHPNLPDGDKEAAGLWHEIAGLPAERIQFRALADNYWSMGIPGPGGPNSEIYIDRGPQYGPDGGPVVDEDRFLEIWNLVFMSDELSQVRSKSDFDIAGPLPKPQIDTGAGLERIAYLLQGKDNMYEIDEVYPVIAKAAELSGRRYGADHDDDVRMRVVADHVRSALMLIGDGVVPGNEARGYVVRRLLRRVVRSMRLLGVGDPSFAELFPASRDVMAGSYPEVASDFDRISQIAYAEEEAFTRTLSAGTQIFDTAVASVRGSGGSTLPGDQAFQLHDTYGFPIELTLEMANEQGLGVDEAGFTALMDQQRERAKADARAKKGGSGASDGYRQLRAAGETRFTGYSALDGVSRVRGIIADGAVVDRAEQGATVELVLEESPFYAESGGQDADTGVISGDGVELTVTDVQRPVKGLVVHTVEVTSGELLTGAELQATVDGAARLAACQAHSATHLVHAALRQVLGPTAVQAGSYNRPGYMRFDYSWNAGVDREVRDQLESITNAAVRDDLAVSAREMDIDQAKKLGALALFGENYGDRVRVIDIAGGDYPETWSRELCGGTHVQRSSQIGVVSFIGEGSVGSGARRVEAYVGYDAFQQLATERALVAGLSEMLKVQPDQLTDRVTRMVAQLKDAEKEIARLRGEQLRNSTADLVASAKDMWGVAFLGQQLPDVAAGDLRQLAMDLRSKIDRPAVVALVGGTAEKPAVVVATNEGARDRRLAAGELIRPACEALGGRGGGKADIAQGGGTNGAASDEALRAVEYAVGHVLQNG